MFSIKRIFLALSALTLGLFASMAMALTTVDVNTATAAELDAIHGIGPGTSGKILAERKNGSFKDWNDFITRVKGVGDNNSQKFAAAGLTVNGVGIEGVAVKPVAVKQSKADKAEAKAAEKAAKDEAKAKAKADKQAAKEAKAAEKEAAKKAADAEKAAKKAAAKN